MKEETIMTGLFGSHPKVKIIDLLITTQDLRYSISDIAEYAQVGRSSVYRILDEMLEQGIIVEKNKIGRIRLFSINEKNPVIKELKTFIKIAAKIETEKEIARQTLKLKARH